MRRRVRKTLLLLLLVVSAALAQSGAQRATPPDRFETVREAIRRLLVEQSLPSLAIAVARDGKIIWEEGFGWADREERIPSNEHTMYSLASVSKPITATGLMLLKERGRIDLDKPINDYLGEAKLRARVGNPADATVRRVASHTAGLPLHYQFFYEDEPYRPPAMDETIRRYANLVTAPGERYQYSNLGYGVLDYVIARVSGKTYADFMREEVFLPLGLTRMSVGIGPRLEKHQAIRYNREGAPLPFYDFDHRGGSAVYASAHDLVRFGMFHLKARLSDQKAILSDAAIDEMQKPLMGDYGLGWGVSQRLGYRVVSHSGGMPGVATILMLVPDHKIAIAVLCNTSAAPVGRIAGETLATLLPNVRNPGQPASNPPEPFKPSTELVGTWRGTVSTYKADIPFTLLIEESGTVRARLGQQLETLVSAVALREGYLTGRMAGDIGTEDTNRKPYTLNLSLKLRGDLLNGAITAISLPTPRGGNALTSWLEVKKSPPSP